MRPDFDRSTLRPEPEPPADTPPPDVHPAVGPLAGMSPLERRLYVHPEAFTPLGEVQENWWRARVAERDQTYADFVVSQPNQVTAGRDRLYLLPLGVFPTEMVVSADFVMLVRSPPLSWLADHLQRFYGLPVTVMDAQSLDAMELPTRTFKGHAQYDAGALLSAIAGQIPADAYSMTAVLNRDLYVFDEQEYAFGYGLHRDRLAVMSFARFDPVSHGRARTEGWQEDLMRRSLSVLAHEVGHTFGMRHCAYYSCLLNGVSHPREVDETPLHLCPVCLRKLAFLETIDPVARYERLADFYAAAKMQGPKEWIDTRLAHLRSPLASAR